LVAPMAVCCVALTPFSRQAIKKYIKANNKLGSTTEATFNSHINRALATGEETGVFERPKGESRHARVWS
jgi:hypothetical protein